MNTVGRFSINPNSKNIVLMDDESLFIDDLTLSKEIGYEFPHYYSDNSITGYRAAIIEVEELDIDYIKSIYGITPNNVYSYGPKKHLVFYFKKSLNKFDYNRITKTLSFLYDGISIKYHFYPANGVSEEFTNKELNSNLVELCTKVFFFIDNKNEYQKLFNISEYEKFLEADNLDVSQVISALYGQDIIKIEKLILGIDKKHNIHKDYGNSFNIVNKYFNSIDKTKTFFYDNFQIEFEDLNSFDYKKSKVGTVITSGDGLYINNFGYYTLDPSGNRKRITDFYIKVHSKIVGNNGKHHFIVTLINESEGVETKKIIWENKTSVGTFSDFIQSYGPFHYYGTAPFIKELHKQISVTKEMPEILQVVGYGHHKDHNVIIFKNGVWDIKHRLFTAVKDKEDDFYYNYNNDGFWVTDKQGNTLSKILTDGIPSLDTNITFSLKEVLDFMGTLYKDNSGAYMIFLAFGMMGYLAYGDQTKQFPLIFTRGITGSGKSAFNEILQKIWGIKKSGSDFENSTLFTMTVTLSYLIKFPYFISEYREAATQRLQKVGTLRSVFDKISQTKGRADQSVVKYDYVAVPVLDGEEMIEDGALRTRSLQYQLLNKHKIPGNFNKILREGGDILNGSLFTYLTKSNGENYQKYLDEGYDIFKQDTTQNRIAQNVASIYAGCMAFDSSEESKEKYIMVLSEILYFQEDDVLENSTSMQIIKVIGKFMETTYQGIYLKRDGIVISRNSLEDYISKYRVTTTLKIGSYREHLITMGFNIEFTEVGEKFLEGIIVPYRIIPKHLLVNHEVYKGYKDWKENNSIC